MNDQVYVLFPTDVDRILRILYHGSRPPGVRYLICGCGRVANLTQSDADAMGWRILPSPQCPVCGHLGAPDAMETEVHNQARKRYLELVDQLVGKAG
jgi:hypothetical protein